MIENILIKNFRGIQTGQIDRFRKFNLLVGPNNCGKSAVLEAIYLACTADRAASLAVFPSSEVYGCFISGTDLLGEQPMTRILRRRSYVEPFANQNGAGVRVHVSNSSAPLRDFQISTTPLLNHSVPDQEDIVALFGFEVKDSVADPGSDEQTRKRHYERRIAFARKLLGEDAGLIENTRAIYCWASNLTHYNCGSAVWALRGQLPPSGHTLFYDVATTLGHLPMDFFRRMIGKVPGWSQKLAQSFSRVLDLRQQLNMPFLPVDQAQQWAQGMIAPDDRIALTIDSFGDGARTAFKLLTPLHALAELANSAPGLFIWEEPELFQNPRTLGRLLIEVTRLMRDKPLQIFVATQSLEVIAHFTALVQDGKIERDDLMAFRLGLEDGKLSSSWFNADNLASWLEDGLDPRVWGDFKAPVQFQFREGGER